ncbi:MAG: hypothetical protein ACI9E5_000457 [Candidatus Omnitrophota bacterium]
MNKKLFPLLIGVALVIKLLLFLYAESFAPEAKFMLDTQWYLQSAESFAHHGVFARSVSQDGLIYHETFRTPGYPLFLSVFHYQCHIPFSGIIVIQIILSIITAGIVFKTVQLFCEKAAALSAFIILFDPSTTIHSMFLLTDTLFVFLLTIFLYFFVKFIKFKSLRCLVLSALILALASYVRPVSYFLGLGMSLFMVVFMARHFGFKIIGYSLIFLTIIYGLIGVWHYRNYIHTKSFVFSNISQAAVKGEGVFSNTERIRKDGKSDHLSSYRYYLNIIPRSYWELFTRPATLKNFGNENLKLVGKIFAYPFILFWMVGMVRGAWRMRTNIYGQICLVVILYFATVTVCAILLNVGSRFRLPMMPCIAMLAAIGFSKNFTSKSQTTN